jgi:hypothetical protein
LKALSTSQGMLEKAKQRFEEVQMKLLRILGIMSFEQNFQRFMQVKRLEESFGYDFRGISFSIFKSLMSF